MMPRKSADKIAKSNKPYGRDDIWAAIRQLGKKDAQFTARDIFDACGHEINTGTIKTYVDCLTKAHILKVCTKGARFKSTVYCLLKDLGAEAPRVNPRGEEVTQGLGTESMWRTMKTMNAFTAAELALMASTSKVKVGENTAKTYLQFMRKAGYVRTVQAKPGKPSRYAFARARDPGPKPPKIQRVKQVFDPNSGTVVWPKAGSKT